MKLIYSGIALLSLLAKTSDAHKLTQHLRYEEAEGPTKEDNGESDDRVVYRESDINLRSDKISGWTNPLSWSDGGEDDDLILDMHFKPLDEDADLDENPLDILNKNVTLDEDIIVSQENENRASKILKKGGNWPGLKKKKEKKEIAPVDTPPELSPQPGQQGDKPAELSPEKESTTESKKTKEAVNPITDAAPAKAKTPATDKQGTEATPASAVAKTKDS